MKLRLLLILTIITSIAVSCRKKASISVSDDFFTCATAGQTFNANVSADRTWKVTVPTGVAVYPTSASGDSPISITVEENKTGAERDLKILFVSDGGSSAEAVVHQEFIEKGVTFSCTPPEITVDSDGGEVKATVKSNYGWKLTLPEGITAIPSETSEGGEKEVTFSIPEYTGEEAITHKPVFVVNSTFGQLSENHEITITQKPLPLPTLTLNTIFDDYDFAGGWFSTEVMANYEWTAEVDAPEGYEISLSKTAGHTEKDTLTVTLTDNLLKTDIDVNVSITCKDKRERTASESITLHIAAPFCTREGVDYKPVHLKDGNWWMSQNLRYLPSGATPSDDCTNAPSGIWYPVDLSKGTLTKDATTIEKNGYLYTAEAAFGIPVGTLTKDNYLSYEGVQGLCPDGWHIPTGEEYLHLAGYVVGYDLYTDAPYLNQSTSKCDISALNADGFNIPTDTWGMVSVTTKYQVSTIMSYILGSTGKSGDKGFTDAKSPIPAYASYKSLMPSKNLKTSNGADSKSIMGHVVRCIKNKKTPPEADGQ